MKAFVAVLLALAGQDPRAPVPDAAAQMEAEKTIREVFKDQYARPTLAERQALARELLKQARSPDNPPAVRYVLLREANALGDLETSSAAAELLAGKFGVNILPLRLRTLNQAIPKTPEEFKPLGEQFLTLADDAIQAGDLDTADKAIQGAVAALRKAKEVALLSRAQNKAKEVEQLRALQDGVKKAEATLQRDPNDPAANGALGRHHCFFRGNWDTGLPMLAKGDQAALKAAAAADLAAPAETAAQIAAGDAWWALAESETAAAKQNLRLRALHWYGKALPKAIGLHKLKLESRLKEMGQKPADPAAPAPFALDDRGFIRNWMLVGPFPNIGHKGLPTDFLGGEADYVPSEGKEVKSDATTLKWASYASAGARIFPHEVPHLQIRAGQQHIVVYAVTWVTLEADQELQFRTSADDGYYVWIGREPVIQKDLHRAAAAQDQDIHAVKLSRGRHRILMKVENITGAHQFLMRVTTPANERATGVTVGLQP
jgi:hypothetical protein